MADMAKVLLADDSATMQKVVDVVLREEGFDVQSANNGEEALQKVASYQPDLVFAYIKLPGINGYELTKQIKASSNIPVVLLAGAFEPVDDALMQECGADNSLVKPFQTEDLLAIIKKLIPDADTSVVAPAAEEDDDIVFDMSGEDDEVVEAEVVEADVEPEIVTEAAGGDPFAAGGVGAQAAAAPVEAEIMEAEVMEAEVVEAEIVEAEVVEAEVVEAEVVEATVVEAAPAAAMPAVEMPSADELSAIFMRTAEEKIIEAIKGADIRNAVVALLEPRINESLNAMLEEAMPVLMQKLLKEMIEGSLSMLNKELENIMWETVPELAESIIKKEIDKIKSTG
jgi:DNA-binding response OmpR family regulator